MNSDPRCVMNVFVHGTILRYVSLIAIFNLVKESVKNNNQEKGLKRIVSGYKDAYRAASFYRLQPIYKQGLHSIKLGDEDIEAAQKQDSFYLRKLFACLFDDVSASIIKDKSIQQSRYYTFGWSGELSGKERNKAASELYTSLVQEQTRLQTETNMPVELNVYSHSHGGNVVLLLAQQEDEHKKQLSIDKFFSFGIPIQIETEQLVLCELFKSVYHFYSTGDIIQISDIVSTDGGKSRRRFGDKNTFELPEKLVQIEVLVDSYKPRHMEFWFFGASVFPYVFYRKRFPIYPLPIAVFTPVICHLLQSVQNVCTDVILQIVKENDVFEFKLSCKRDASITSKQYFDVFPLKERAFLWLKIAKR